MKRFLAALLALTLTLAAPAAAQSYFFGGSGSVYANPSSTYEACGQGVSGAGTTVTAHASNNTKGSYTAALCTTASAWSAFDFEFGISLSAGQSFLCDVSLDGGSTIKINSLFLKPGAAGAAGRYPFPLKVAAGATPAVRCQSSLGGTTVQVALRGTLADATTPPGYDNIAVILGGNTANSRASSIAVLTDSAWVTLNNSAPTSGAVLAIMGDTASAGAAQGLTYHIGYGATPTEVASGWTAATTGSPNLRATSLLIRTPLTGGLDVKAKIVGATTTDTYNFQVFGFN